MVDVRNPPTILVLGIDGIHLPIIYKAYYISLFSLFVVKYELLRTRSDLF